MWTPTRSAPTGISERRKLRNIPESAEVWRGLSRLSSGNGGMGNSVFQVSFLKISRYAA
jgi:hypothetical protein